MKRIISIAAVLMLSLNVLSVQSAPATSPQSQTEQKVQQGNEEIQALLKRAMELKEKHPELFKGTEGILVTKVLPDSQGAKASLKPGDVLISYGGTPLNSTEQLVKLTGERPSEQSVRLGYLRGGVFNEAVIHGGRIGVGITSLIKGTMGKERLVDQMFRLNLQGQNARQGARYQQALTLYKKGLVIGQKERNKKWVGTFLGNIGTVYQSLGRYTKALEHYERALAVKREAGDLRSIGYDRSHRFI